MILCEDKRIEKEVLSGISCYAVPIELFLPEDGGEAVITTYEFCREKAEKWSELFSGRLLCEESVLWLEKEFGEIAKNLGYVRYNNVNEHMLEYIFTTDMQLTKIDVDAKVSRISSNAVLSKICEASGCDIEIADDGEDVIFAVVENGILLAYAGINDLFYADNSVEISVETAPDQRRKGYGAACVAELTMWLANKGKNVRYKCSADNHASFALAEKCGFVLEGQRFSLVYEKI